MNKINSLITAIAGRHAAPSRWMPLLVVTLLVAITGCESPEERVANYVASAEQLFEDENLIKAELEAKNALQIDPKNAEARYILARIAGSKGEFREMAGNLSIAIESRPDFIDARVSLGKLLAQVGLMEEAEEQLTELDKLAPQDAEVRMLRARLLSAKGDVEQAEVELRAAISAEPDNVVAIGLLASLTAATDVDEALVIVDEAIAKTKESRELRLLKIDILTKAARGEAVEAAYRSLISEFPDETQYRFSLAQFLANEGKIEAVGDVLMAAVDHDRSDQEAKLTLVRFVAGTQGAEEGVALLEEFLEEDPTATELRILLADQYRRDGDTDSAKAEYQIIADTEGNEDVGLTARTRIAGIQIADGELEAATAIIDDVLALDPLNADANYFRGLLEFQASDFRGAVSALRSALREEPDNARAQWLLARTHAQAGDSVLAVDAYRRLMNLAPQIPGASLELARLLVDQGNMSQAEELLAEKVVTIPLDADISKAMIAILLDQKRFDDALSEAQRFGSTSGNAAIGSYFEGGVYQAWDQHDKAVEAFRKSLEARPDAREPLQSLVTSFARLGRMEEARDYLQERSEQFPENLYIKTLLGQVLAGTGDEGAAREIFEEALSENSDWLPAYAALASMESADPDAQIALYRRGLEAAPESQQMVLLLGSAYEKSGEVEKAIAVYEEAMSTDVDMPIVANNLAALLADHRQDTASFNRALEVAKQLETTDQPILLDTLGWVYYRLGEYDKAQRMLERAVEGEPGVPVLNYHLGMNYLAQNKPQLAIEQLRAATENPDVQYFGRDEAEKALAELLESN